MLSSSRQGQFVIMPLVTLVTTNRSFSLQPHLVGNDTKFKIFYITLVSIFVRLFPGAKDLKFLFKGLFYHLRPDELNISADWE